MYGILSNQATQNIKEPYSRKGRDENELRDIELEQGLLNRADGSARFSQGGSTVLVAVYGPMESKQTRKELLDKAFIEVTYKPRSGIPGSHERKMEYFIRNAIENVVLSSLHPRTYISIVVQVLNEDGAILPTSINGTCLALLDAGIPLSSLLSSCSCALMKDRLLLLDPNEDEEKNAAVVFNFTFNSSLKGLVSSTTSGTSDFEEEEYFAALDASRHGCSTILNFLRESMEKQYTS